MRDEALTVRIESKCAHCGTPMEIEIDSDLNIEPKDEGCNPVIFVPDVDLLNLQEDSIIDSF
ncbi:hypothetical protein ACFL4G_07825 [Thermodesulfobacteriota bacterium]